jgi:hypothetical protein
VRPPTISGLGWAATVPACTDGNARWGVPTAGAEPDQPAVSLPQRCRLGRQVRRSTDTDERYPPVDEFHGSFASVIYHAAHGRPCARSDSRRDSDSDTRRANSLRGGAARSIVSPLGSGSTASLIACICPAHCTPWVANST